MPVGPNALTTLEAVKVRLGMPDSNVTYDDLLCQFIDSASAQIETYCHRRFIQGAYTEYQDGIANNRIDLGQWPVVGVPEVYVDSKSLFGPETLKDPTTYAMDLDSRGDATGIILLCGRLFPRGFRNIKISYEAGYADIASLPHDLQDACLWITKWLYEIRDDDRLGIATKGKNQENTTYTSDWDPWIKRILDNYQRVGAPSGTRQVWTG